MTLADLPLADLPLADLPLGARATVRAVDGPPGLAQRLLEMGLTPGTEVEVLRFAPLGDPLEIRLWGYLLTLRKQDARCVQVAQAGGRA
ncbi:MAG: ferrous iron transport protein A [Planctomycetia bacterium]